VDFEIITIPAASDEVREWRFVENDWMVIADGTTKTAYEYNRKTGETRPFDYAEAMRAIYG
jgi:hypothetical protein